MVNLRRTVEVFAGGALKGLYIAGYLKYKEENGLDKFKTQKIGCSVGSIVAAMESRGVKYNELDDYFKNNEAVIRHLFPPDISSILTIHGAHLPNPFAKKEEGDNERDIFSSINLQNTGIADTKNLEKLLSEFLGDATFSDHPDLELIATDRGRQRTLYLNSRTCPNMTLYDGCLTSSAIPVIYDVRGIIYEGQNRFAVDGGIAKNFPIQRAFQKKGIRNIVGITFADLTENQEIEDKWFEQVLPLISAGSVIAEKEFMDDILDDDYCSFASNNSAKALRTFKGRRNVAILAPNLPFKYGVESDYTKFKELSDLGYEASRVMFKNLEKVQRKIFF